MSIPGIPLPRDPPRRVPARPPRSEGADLGLWLARLAAIAALLIVGYLAYATSTAGGQVAGCDDTEAGCSQIFASRWATWLGIGVGVPAMFVYLTAVAATWMAGASPSSRTRRLGWTLLAGSSVLAGGAAIWFIGLQLLALGSLCWYCLTLHAGGLFLACFAAWRLPREMVAGGGSFKTAFLAAGMGALGVAALVGGQLLIAPDEPGMKVFEVEALKRRTDVPASEAADATRAMAPVEHAETQPEAAAVADTAIEPAAHKSTRVPQHPWSHRRISLLGGMASLDMYDRPVIGDREAQRPLVEVFDYTCSHCREFYGLIHKAQADFGDEFTLVLLPIPMRSKCNAFVEIDVPNHATACELTRLAIAVWQASPDAFEQFHAWMMQGAKPPSPAAAEAAAARLVGEEKLTRALSDSAVEEQLKDNCRIYSLVRDSSRNGTIPKLVYDRAVSSGLPSSEEQFRLFLETQVGLKPVAK